MSSEKVLQQTLVEYEYPQERQYDEVNIGAVQKDGTYQLIKHAVSKDLVIKNAKLAASCVMTPNEGDLVQIYITPKQIYIMAILEKVLPIPSEYTLNGKVTLGIEESQVVVDANKVSIKTKEIESRAKNIKNTSVNQTNTSKRSITKVSESIRVESETQHQIISKSNLVQTDQDILQSRMRKVLSNRINFNCRDDVKS
ncbi:DUF3540 domain-containing protein [Francisellaceae bacterium]|nr:DUF3540 domain-containing protein [Francisellaceae bacterium]